MDTKTQVEAARGSVLAIPSPRSTLVVTGADGLTWLNGLITCDLVKKQAGEAAYGLVVTRNGRVLADVVVFLDEGRLLLAVPSGVVETLTRHFEHYVVMEDAQTAPGSQEFEMWDFHGPRSLELLEAARASGGVGAHLDRTGLGGAIVFVPRERSEQVRRRLVRGVSELGGAVGDALGWQALRLERGVPEFAEDFDDKTYPQEAGIEKVAVSFDKGCYLGQEVVCMLELRGHVKRKLLPLIFDGSEVPHHGATVTDSAGAAVGEITSAALSPTLGRAVALAMVKRSHGEPASVLLVDGARAQVVDRPA